jgi:predicted TIM-barrel fold metal-dependent hydrolase
MVVVDAVVHGYNWPAENWAIPEAAMACEGIAEFHGFLSPDDPSRLSKAEFLRNWQVADIEEALFVESPVDLAVFHGTPIFDFFKDGHSDTRKGYQMRTRNPDRVFVYGAVNPLEGKKALDEMERLVNDHNVNGIKIYAAAYSQGKTHPISLDDPEFGFPFIERAIKLGVRVIATHKALPVGPVNSHPYGMGDIPGAAARFPEMNFEIVHSGFAFLEETAMLAGAFPNVWFNLEVSASLAINAPRRFAEFMGLLLLNGAGDRLIHASGCPLVHPRPPIEALLSFEMPEELVAGYGYPRMTDELKRGILGENFLRLHNVNVEEFKLKISNDAWSKKRAEAPNAEPWSHFRRRVAIA